MCAKKMAPGPAMWEATPTKTKIRRISCSRYRNLGRTKSGSSRRKTKGGCAQSKTRMTCSQDSSQMATTCALRRTARGKSKLKNRAFRGCTTKKSAASWTWHSMMTKQPRWRRMEMRATSISFCVKKETWKSSKSQATSTLEWWVKEWTWCNNKQPICNKEWTTCKEWTIWCNRANNRVKWWCNRANNRVNKWCNRANNRVKWWWIRFKCKDNKCSNRANKWWDKPS